MGVLGKIPSMGEIGIFTGTTISNLARSKFKCKHRPSVRKRFFLVPAFMLVVILCLCNLHLHLCWHCLCVSCFRQHIISCDYKDLLKRLFSNKFNAAAVQKAKG